jgi:hypothetical protein
LLVIALGLGGSGNNYDSLEPDPAIEPDPMIQNPSGPQGLPGSTVGPQGPTVTPGQKGGLQGPTATPGQKGGPQRRQGRQIRVLPDNKRCPYNDGNGRICNHIPGNTINYSIVQ